MRDSLEQRLATRLRTLGETVDDELPPPVDLELQVVRAAGARGEPALVGVERRRRRRRGRGHRWPWCTDDGWDPFGSRLADDGRPCAMLCSRAR